MVVSLMAIHLAGIVRCQPARQVDYDIEG
jgi:hypothetical protein